MTEIKLTTRLIAQRGIELPWQRIERYGPNTMLIATPESKQRPPKGTVLEEGTVFIPYETLWKVAEQDVWDSQMGSPLLLGYQEGLALEQAGLAVAETKGGYHGTDKLRELIGYDG